MVRAVNKLLIWKSVFRADLTRSNKIPPAGRGEDPSWCKRGVSESLLSRWGHAVNKTPTRPSSCAETLFYLISILKSFPAVGFISGVRNSRGGFIPPGMVRATLCWCQQPLTKPQEGEINPIFSVRSPNFDPSPTQLFFFFFFFLSFFFPPASCCRKVTDWWILVN